MFFYNFLVKPQPTIITVESTFAWERVCIIDSHKMSEYLSWIQLLVTVAYGRRQIANKSEQTTLVWVGRAL